LDDTAPSDDDMAEVFRTAARDQIAALTAGLGEVADAAGLWPQKKAELCDIAHNLKGQGSSFGFPLITQIGLSLNRMLKDLEQGDPRRIKIALAHAQALSTVLEKNIQGTGGASGKALIQRLQGLANQVTQSSIA
jgi:chemotaxis protein histidine kinase CheA